MKMKMKNETKKRASAGSIGLAMPVLGIQWQSIALDSPICGRSTAWSYSGRSDYKFRFKKKLSIWMFCRVHLAWNHQKTFQAFAKSKQTDNNLTAWQDAGTKRGDYGIC